MYNPVTKLLAGIRQAWPAQMFPWDQYFPEMAEADFLTGNDANPAVKSFFFRKAPFGGAYAIAGGVTKALRGIHDLDLTDPEFERGLRDVGISQAYMEKLKWHGKIKVKVFAVPEGTPVFPDEPFFTAVGRSDMVRLVEGIITEALNFSTLAMTKWYRLVRTVRPGTVLDFSRRRAQNHLEATLCAMLAGCGRTSNAEIRRYFDFLIAGTMGHEWMQSYGDVSLAFRDWLKAKPHKPIGLVDTWQCLQHDFPAWLQEVDTARESIKAANPAIWGWRNDSGDLSYLTIEQYRRFFQHPLAQDEWFRDRMRIFLTGDLDEYAAKKIIGDITAQSGQAGFKTEDILRRIIWAAGTKPGTCSDQSALGGVAKLMEIKMLACIKLAFDDDGNRNEKTSIPGFNRSALVEDEAGEIRRLLIYPSRQYLINEQGRLTNKFSGQVHDIIAVCHKDNPNARSHFCPYTLIPRQQLVYDSIDGDGFTPLWDDPDISEIPQRINREVDQLHWRMSSLDNPYQMKVGLTPDLFDLRKRMIEEGVLREDALK